MHLTDVDGPDKVLVNPEYKVINVTKGSKLVIFIIDCQLRLTKQFFS